MDAVCRYVQARLRSKKRPYLCFDEWNVWYRTMNPEHTNGRGKFAPHLIEEEYNLEDALGQFNVVSVPVKSGEKIDLASPQRTMEPEERELLQKIADQMHGRFKSHVAAARPAIQPDAELWDGRVMTGQEAFESSLIDQVGYLDDAIELARQLAAVDADASIVMLRRDNDRAYTVLDKSPNSPANASLIPLSSTYSYVTRRPVRSK